MGRIVTCMVALLAASELLAADSPRGERNTTRGGRPATPAIEPASPLVTGPPRPFPASTAAASPAGPSAFPPAQAMAVTAIPVSDSQDGHRREVFRLNSVPATEAVNLLQQFLKAEASTAATAKPNLALTADPVSNTILAGGSPQAIDEVGKLLKKIDQPAAMVVIEVMLGQVPAPEAKSAASPSPGVSATSDVKPTAEARDVARLIDKPERLEILSRARLTTLDNQQASIQIGRSEAMVTGVNISSFGQTNSVAYRSIGTQVTVTPRVGADGQVTMSLEVEHSGSGPTEEGVPVSISKSGEPVRAPSMDTLTTRTTVCIPAGKTAVIGGQSRQSRPARDLLVLVTPHVLRRGEGVAEAPAAATKADKP